MASITIRNLDEELKTKLRVRAAERGRSMEEEVREILRCALSEQPRKPKNLVVSIRERFLQVGGVELPAIERDVPRVPPSFGQ